MTAEKMMAEGMSFEEMKSAALFEIVQAALKLEGGVGKAAARLDVHRNTIYRILAANGITRPMLAGSERAA